MLSPETIKALDEALGAVIAEAGDDPQYADLVDSLTAAQHAAAQVEGSGDAAPDPGAEPDGNEASPNFDAHSFDHAEKAMTKRRAKTKDDQKGAGA